MKRFCQPLLLLWLTAVVGMNTLGNTAEAAALTNIPHSNKTSPNTKLVIEDSLITLSEVDKLALASYPTLEELHLDGNLVTAIPAKYFSIVPNLRVLSLSRNNISSLDPEAFFGLNVLTELDLSHNLLTSFPLELFKGLKHLQVLKLQENPWNCSCPLLASIQVVKEANVSIGGPEVTCASPDNETGNDLLNATAVCYPSPLRTINRDPRKPLTQSKESWGSSTMLKTTLLPNQNHSISKDQTAVLGNTWKFTVCVGALALTTFMLIIFAIKGPSWYKLYHNYRHRRLDQERDEGENAVSSDFSERYLNHQTFTFKQGDGQREDEEEEWDDYFEDPYIKREELHGGEEDLPKP